MNISHTYIFFFLKGDDVHVRPTCSNAASFESLRSCKTEPNVCYKPHSTISFSSLTGESNAGDYQDCGASSMLLMHEPPWCTMAHDSTTPSGIRNDAVLRYKEKKKTRKWVNDQVSWTYFWNSFFLWIKWLIFVFFFVRFEKTVRYATRKARADVRKRVKGRFVKAGDAYDYDPMSQTRSYWEFETIYISTHIYIYINTFLIIYLRPCLEKIR